MRERSKARYSFICFLLLRSTAMWVILWLSISSSFFAFLVRRRFRRAAGGTDADAAVTGGGGLKNAPSNPLVQGSGEEVEWR
ncbi:unnamed protein product [Linum tenue]|uniref:Uncharacterized protein n=1 Tax=Linum tenue TaxID=586396 RepID=A0AAV0N6B9_9ROSI|nr:unnamed protein product [Linum tenue]